MGQVAARPRGARRRRRRSRDAGRPRRACDGSAAISPSAFGSSARCVLGRRPRLPPHPRRNSTLADDGRQTARRHRGRLARRRHQSGDPLQLDHRGLAASRHVLRRLHLPRMPDDPGVRFAALTLSRYVSASDSSPGSRQSTSGSTRSASCSPRSAWVSASVSRKSYPASFAVSFCCWNDRSGWATS